MGKSILMLMALVFCIATMATRVPKAKALFIVGPTDVSIRGVVYCSLNSNATAPPFADATVLLRCPAGVSFPSSSDVTDSTGEFHIRFPTRGQEFPPDCTVEVFTSLSQCSSTLPSSGRLSSPLTFTGFERRIIIFRRVVTYAANDFRYDPSL